MNIQTHEQLQKHTSNKNQRGDVMANILYYAYAVYMEAMFNPQLTTTLTKHKSTKTIRLRLLGLVWFCLEQVS